MNGPEHYREAEALARTALNWTGGDWGKDMTPAARLARKDSDVAMAQVHATLALAAATALGREGEGRTQPSKDKAAWFDAAAECRKAATA
jgi:hypothetical protein